MNVRNGCSSLFNSLQNNANEEEDNHLKNFKTYKYRNLILSFRLNTIYFEVLSIVSFNSQ